MLTCFVYGLLYLTLFAYPYSFGVERQWLPSRRYLPFLPLLLGQILASGSMMIRSMLRARRNLENTARNQLEPLILGTSVLFLGLAVFAWTSDPKLTWVPQVVAGLLIGFGFQTSFSGIIVFIVAIHPKNANTALVGNAFSRSLVGSIFPLFSSPMSERLGTRWATSILALTCLFMVGFSIFIYQYGCRIRDDDLCPTPALDLANESHTVGPQYSIKNGLRLTVLEDFSPELELDLSSWKAEV